MSHVERIAKAFHERYEELAPHFGYQTRRRSAVPWDQVPDDNKNLMMAVVERLFADGIVTLPSAVQLADRATSTAERYGETLGLITGIFNDPSLSCEAKVRDARMQIVNLADELPDYEPSAS